jgi:hypothetical protein
LEAWLCNAKPTCGDCRFHFPGRQPFHGSIERRLLAGLDLTRFASTPVSFAKFPVVAGESEERGCIVITQLEGMRQYCQSGTMALLTAGDTTLIDSGRPWTSDCAGDCARLDAFSKDLKHRGFSFVGPTVVYAYMQAVGMVNDHLVGCFRHREIRQGWKTGSST